MKENKKEEILENDKIYSLILDTNMLVSFLISKNPNSPVVQIYDLLLDNYFTPVNTSDIMDEYIDVLNRKKFNFTKENIDALINVIEENGAYIIPRDLYEDELIGLNDKDDEPFLKAIITLNEILDEHPFENYLITRNTKDFPNVPYIITVNDFMNIIEAKDKFQQQHTSEHSYEL